MGAAFLLLLTLHYAQFVRLYWVDGDAKKKKKSKKESVKIQKYAVPNRAVQYPGPPVRGVVASQYAQPPHPHQQYMAQPQLQQQSANYPRHQPVNYSMQQPIQAGQISVQLQQHAQAHGQNYTI